MFRSYILPVIVWVFYKSLYFTWRITIEEPDELKQAIKEQKPFILAHWHGDELALIHFFSIYRLATMTSTSKDGELVDKIVRWLGGATSRGSSTRGGVGALKGLIRLIQKGYNSSVAVDGPKGPLHKVKPGIFEISKLTGCPIYWAGVYCDNPHIFKKSWNQAILPKPFSKVYIQWNGPYGPIRKEDDPKNPSFAAHLENELNAAKHQVLKKFEVNNAKC
jgi:lysophospholipid acyltransferase (LPLAT)-like uncharacterized protein